MNTRERIDRAGFYPGIVAAALARAMGAEEARASVCQVDAAFDRAHVFRHLTLAVLGRAKLVVIHVDELEDGAVAVDTAIHRLSRLASLSFVDVYSEPAQGGRLVETTLILDLGSTRRAHIEPAHCDDPNCEADHGYSATASPEDLVMRFSLAADGEEAFADALEFSRLLAAETGAERD